jgi:L-fucose isomerase-like protein
MLMKLRIALIPLARKTFDMELAGEVAAAVRTRLALDLELVDPIQQNPAWNMITDLPSACAVADWLKSQPLDLLIILQATFADSTMVTALAEAVDAPLFLWAIPEARTGGRLRLNSLCGVNLAAHALKLRGKDYEYVYAAPDSTEALKKIRTLAAAGNVHRRLRSARLGVLGEHPDGFDTCHLDEAELGSLGLTVERIELSSVFAAARAQAPEAVAGVRSGLVHRLEGLDMVDQPALDKSFRVYLALKQIATEKNLAGLAVRCWPEFFTDLGCAACGPMSMLSDECVPCSCEADINGTVTQLILQMLSDAPAFGSDLVSVDEAADTAVLWHCGLAPLSMAGMHPHAGIHSNRKLPLVMEFPLKPGRVTIARLSRASGTLRLVYGRGEIFPASKSFSGTSGVVLFERPVQQVLDTIIHEGLEHHVSLTYGDHVNELLALAHLLKLPVLHL